MRPALFATLVIAPIVVLQGFFVAVGLWAASIELLSVLAIDAGFWVVTYVLWSQSGRIRH
ncbi:hypothetical protein JQN58_33625 [Aneurinibacillus sp. BA2021]|nr:hypothetical protein [Aneurinibacillus sp. BA2021]